MSLKALKCPSCGADISLDDNREFGFCSYCGSRIQIGEQINVHVTHEFKDGSPNVNVTNNYYYDNGNDVPENVVKPHVVIEKPKGKKMGWGIVLASIGIIGLCSSGGKGTAYIVVYLIMIALAAFLLVSYSRSMQVYREAIRNASKSGVVFQESESKTKKRNKRH